MPASHMIRLRKCPASAAALTMAAFFVCPWPDALGDPVVNDPDFGIELYATVPAGVDGIAYSSGGRFGRGLYATTTTDHSIHYISGPGTSSVFATGLPLDRYEPAFDPTGAFGGDLYVAATEDNTGPGDYVVRVGPSGAVTTFFTSGFNEVDFLGPGLAFGPSGSAFGNYFFVPDMEHQNLNRFDPAANRTSIGPVIMSYHDAKDIEFSRGGAWGTYAFVLDAAARRILRVGPSGATDYFFEWPTDVSNMRSIAFGDGGLFGNDLFSGDNSNQLVRIDSAGNSTLFATGLGTGKIHATEFGNNELFVGTGGGEIYRIFAIPEPGTLSLLAAACLFAVRRSRA